MASANPSRSRRRIALWLYNHDRMRRALRALGFRRVAAWIVGFGDAVLTGVANPISGAFGAMQPDHAELVAAYRRGEASALGARHAA